MDSHSSSRLIAVIGVAAVTIIPTTASAAGTFNIYGFAQSDLMVDTQRVDPQWEDAFRPSKIETTKGAFGSDGQTSISAKQSRLGVSGDFPLDNNLGAVKFKFEFDAFGVGTNAGQTAIRFRHMYGEWGWLLAGQTNTLFMDIDTFPNVVDYWGPTGMVFVRNPQIRLTPFNSGNSHFSIALEKPSNDIDVGVVRELDPALGSNIQNDEKWPDLTAQYYYSSGWGHVQLAGIARDVGFDTRGTLNNQPKNDRLGWGVNLSGHIALFEKDKLIGSGVYGQGIATYMNDGGVDLAPGGTPQAVKPQAVPLTGVMGYYDHYWNDQLSTSLGYSLTQVANTTFQQASAFKRGEYASINLLYTPTAKILIGGEMLWGKRTDFGGQHGDDVRFQFTVKYDFGASITM